MTRDALPSREIETQVGRLLEAHSAHKPFTPAHPGTPRATAGERGDGCAGGHAGQRRSACGTVTPQLARARLVRLLRCRRADRVWALRLGLSDGAALDPGRYRPRFVRGWFRLTDRANAWWRAGRQGPFGTVRSRRCCGGDLRQRADLCGDADFSDGARPLDPAPGRELRAWPGPSRAP